MKKLIFIIILLLFISAGLASAVKTNSVNEFTLLAVSQKDNGTLKGSTAKLYLNIKPGSGSIFIESYPTAKVDTQVATRLANEVACEFSDVDCNSYDFFYTIHADAPIIGGPSAGGATAVLTLASLENIALRKDVAMTGTITSGGIIGPVAGIKEKVQAAQRKNNTKAIIPFTAILKDINTSDNFTRNSFVSLEDFENISIEVIPVINLREALNAAAIKTPFDLKSVIATPTDAYQVQMKETSETLCSRTEELMSNAQEKDLYEDDLFVVGEELYNKSINASSQNKFYPQASFCFSANVRFRQLLLQDQDQELLRQNLERLAFSIYEFDNQIDNITLETFSDLETYSIVKERLLEAKQYIDDVNRTNISSSLLASAIERYYSGFAWSAFFGLPGQKLVIDDFSLQHACGEEIRNVESRMNYLETFLPEMYLEEHKTNLGYAYAYADQEEFALCLFKASKTKADVNLYLSSISLQNTSISDVIDAKLQRTAEIIEEHKKEDIFPILGYSYYDYVPLLEGDEVTQFLFAEYALALSDLQDYFPQQSKRIIPFNKSDLFILLSGFFIGMFVMLIIKRKSHRKIDPKRAIRK